MVKYQVIPSLIHIGYYKMLIYFILYTFLNILHSIFYQVFTHAVPFCVHGEDRQIKIHDLNHLSSAGIE